VEILKYKEFEGSAELDMARNVCRGKILYIDDVVTYESKLIGGLQKQFEDAVDDYIETCNQIGKLAQKSCRGQFNVRVGSELHREATRRSVLENISLNEVVCRALSLYLVPAGTRGVSQVNDKLQMTEDRGVTTASAPLATPIGIYASLGLAAVSVHDIQKFDDENHQPSSSYLGTLGAVSDLTRISISRPYVN
jgi:predicted HicB family RNase H-like nuclease